MNEVGIVSYGAFIPRNRIKVEEIAQTWGRNPEEIKKGLGIHEKSTPGLDEDVATIGVEAARFALARTDVNPKDIGAIYVGSESHPYAVKPTGTIIGEAIGATPSLMVADYEFACKAGTAAMQNCLALIKAGMSKYGLAIGADTAQAAPGDALEYSAAAGGAAYLMGSKKVIAKIDDTCSFTTDTPDFWRREGRKYPAHGGRFTGSPAYFRHIMNAAQMLMKKVGTEPKDYDHAIFHQPNGKFPVIVAKKLGFTEEQIKTGLLSPRIGNTYSGSSLLGLAAVLDIAQPGDRIFLTSYGSGAGSDSFDITVTNEMKEFPHERAPTVEQLINRKTYINYSVYTKFRDILYRE
ncbi:MAG TPA: hydroxymethylglutaryl-CoA synthase [Thermoplasmata archaeon]|nr:hydroxymethylglutaryl-CoA synthase [Thermoplasmata archaeon]